MAFVEGWSIPRRSRVLFQVVTVASALAIATGCDSTDSGGDQNEGGEPQPGRPGGPIGDADHLAVDVDWCVGSPSDLEFLPILPAIDDPSVYPLASAIEAYTVDYDPGDGDLFTHDALTFRAEGGPAMNLRTVACGELTELATWTAGPDDLEYTLTQRTHDGHRIDYKIRLADHCSERVAYCEGVLQTAIYGLRSPLLAADGTGRLLARWTDAWLDREEALDAGDPAPPLAPLPFPIDAGQELTVYNPSGQESLDGTNVRARSISLRTAESFEADSPTVCPAVLYATGSAVATLLSEPGRATFTDDPTDPLYGAETTIPLLCVDP